MTPQRFRLLATYKLLNTSYAVNRRLLDRALSSSTKKELPTLFSFNLEITEFLCFTIVLCASDYLVTLVNCSVH